MKMYSQHFAGIKANFPKRNSGYLNVAQITVFETAVFKAKALEILVGKNTVTKGAAFIFPFFQGFLAEILVLKVQVRIIGHFLGED